MNLSVKDIDILHTISGKTIHRMKNVSRRKELRAFYFRKETRISGGCAE